MNANLGTPTDLSLLASAIAGRRTVVHVSPAQVRQLFPYNDGHSIVLPHGSGPHAWLTVVAQALLMQGDSLHSAAMRRLLGRPDVARRYAWLEVHRSAAQLRDRLPPAFTRLLDSSAPAHASTSAEHSLALAADVRSAPNVPDWAGTVRPFTVLRQSGGQARRSGATEASTKASRDARPSSPEPERPVFEEDEATEDSQLLKLFRNPLRKSNPLSEMLLKLLQAGSQKGAQENAPQSQDEGGELPTGRMESAWKRGVQAVLSRLSPEQLPDTTPEAPSALKYPEWDHAAQRYRPDWVSVDELDPWRSEGPRDLKGTLTPPSMRLHRELSQLARNFEMHRKQPDGTEFDTGRLLDYAVALRTGDTAARADVFRASRRTRRDLGVVVLMDASSSTQECNERGESIFEHLSRAAYHLTLSFDKLGDTVAWYAYQSWSRHLVRLLRIKGHEERWSGRVAERLAELDSEGYTRTGAAIRHTHYLLRTEMRLPNRLLVLVTDGFSYDNDYQARHAEEDTRRALTEARDQGTACVCVCIGGTLAARKLEQVFGATNLLLVDDASQIDSRIRPLCQRALAGVSHRSLSATRAPHTHHVTP